MRADIASQNPTGMNHCAKITLHTCGSHEVSCQVSTLRGANLAFTGRRLLIIQSDCALLLASCKLSFQSGVQFYPARICIDYSQMRAVAVSNFERKIVFYKLQACMCAVLLLLKSPDREQLAIFSYKGCCAWSTKLFQHPPLANVCNLA